MCGRSAIARPRPLSNPGKFHLPTEEHAIHEAPGRVAQNIMAAYLRAANSSHFIQNHRPN